MTDRPGSGSGRRLNPGADARTACPRYFAYNEQILVVPNPTEPACADSLTRLPKPDQWLAPVLAETLGDIAAHRDLWALYADIDLARHLTDDLWAGRTAPPAAPVASKDLLVRQVQLLAEQSGDLPDPVRRALADEATRLLVGYSADPIGFSVWAGQGQGRGPRTELALDRWLWQADDTDLRELVGGWPQHPGQDICSPTDPINAIAFFRPGPLGTLLDCAGWFGSDGTTDVNWEVYPDELEDWLGEHRPNLLAVYKQDGAA